MPSSKLQRLFFLSVAPAVVLFGVVVVTIWGENGIIQRRQLTEELDVANEELALIQAENQRLLLELKQMERDPRVLSRAVADELHWSSEDATIYRFEGKVRARDGRASGEPPR